MTASIHDRFPIGSLISYTKPTTGERRYGIVVESQHISPFDLWAYWGRTPEEAMEEKGAPKYISRGNPTLQLVEDRVSEDELWV